MPESRLNNLSRATQGTAALAATRGAAAAPANGKAQLEPYLPLSSLRQKDRHLLILALTGSDLTASERARVEQLVHVKAAAVSTAVLVGTKRHDAPASAAGEYQQLLKGQNGQPGGPNVKSAAAAAASTAVVVGMKEPEAPVKGAVAAAVSTAVLVGTKRLEAPAAPAGGTQQLLLNKGQTHEPAGLTARPGGLSTAGAKLAPAAAAGLAAKTGNVMVQRTVPAEPSKAAPAVLCPESPALDMRYTMHRPPFFNGREGGMRVKSWLGLINDWLKISPAVPSDKAVIVAASYLRGEAAGLWRARERTLKQQGKDAPDWEAFRNAMMLWYGPTDPVTRKKIDAVKQIGSLQGYMRQVVILFGDLNKDTHHSEMVHVLFRGLKPELAECVSRMDPMTGKEWASWTDAANHVLMHDSLLQAYGPFTEEAQGSGNGQGARQRKRARRS